MNTVIAARSEHTAAAVNMDYFGAEWEDKLRAAHRRVSAFGSRLYSLRALLAAVAKDRVAALTLHETVGESSEHYLLQFDGFTLRVKIATFNHLFNGHRRTVHLPGNALDFNRLLKDMQREWPLAQRDAYLDINFLLTKAFVLCSEKRPYDVDSDAGEWAMFFDDPTGNVQATLTVTMATPE